MNQKLSKNKINNSRIKNSIDINQQKYQQIYKTYNIVCNNTDSHGDCYGESYCKNFVPNIGKRNRFVIIPEYKCKHKNVYCQICDIEICGHCHELCWNGKCPSCMILIV